VQQVAPGSTAVRVAFANEGMTMADGISFKTDDAAIDIAAAGAALARHWGIEGRLTVLPGEFDQNFMVALNGQPTHVLKIMRPGCEAAFVDLQCCALRHVVACDPALPVPAVVAARDGADYVRLPGDHGAGRLAWLITAMPGHLYALERPKTAALAHAVGVAHGRLGVALSDFRHAALARSMKWDLAAADWIVSHPQAIPEPARRGLVDGIAARFTGDLKARLAALPHVAIHNDLNDHNFLVDAGAGDVRVSGLLDFGDMIPGARVADLAIAAAYLVLDEPRPMATLEAYVAGVHEVAPLGDEELALLWPLLLTRLAVSVTNSGLGKLARPDDPYVVVSARGAWAFLEASACWPEDYVTARLRRACGRPAHPGAASLATHLATLPPAAVLAVSLRDAPVLDLSVAGPGSPDDPQRFDMTALGRHVDAVAVDGVALGRYAEPRLIYTAPAFVTQTTTGRERRTVHLGVDVFVPPGSVVRAPYDGAVVDVAIRPEDLDYGGVIVLEHRTADGVAFYTLYGHLSPGQLDHRAGSRVRAGEPIGVVGAPGENGGWPPHLHVQLGLTTLGRGCDWPGVAAPDDVDAWLALYPNPARLLGVDAARVDGRPAAESARVDRRRHRFGHNVKTSYRRPVTAVRGIRHHLYDAWGREYIDAYNNVPQVGHCHPRVVHRIAEQARLLQTNTRYLQDVHLDFGDALAARCPAPLEVCFFVNSGSEANELAIRLARAYTGARDTVVLEEGYHGNTNTAIALSHYKFAGQGGSGPEPWVHVAALPDPYRGRYRGPDCGAAYAAEVGAILDRLVAERRRPAAFIAETLPSVGGQIVPPHGYLADVYARVRAAGGLCIADEVQTGYGRLGEWFFGFEGQGVVPDILVLGKPIGNGHPIGAVVTTRAIADAFANGMEFFSTFGGSSVACAVGCEVLAIVDDERLMAHARRLGERLLGGLRALAQTHALIGDVRGHGLFLGIEFVDDREARTPASAQTEYIVERLRDQRILVGTEGHDNNIMKVRPPLTFDEAAADRVLAALSVALAERPAQPKPA
jgi:4-aminobutyrate aminotransferase-like enzyme/Ser/Thr protein kinase RdoA (MazF antagonist)